VDGDYNRKTGLVGDGSTKYLDSNRNNNADPQDSKHLFSYFTQVVTTGAYKISMGSGQSPGDSLLGYRWDGFDRLRYKINNSTISGENGTLSPGAFGASRLNSSQISIRRNGGSNSFNISSVTPTNATIQLFRATNINLYAAHRLAFYSIGESLNLALLDARVTTLVNAIDAAIP
jgi:hypothetical protein